MSLGTLFIISAPSGAGKTSLIHAVRSRLDHVVLSVSHTTREPRSGECHGVDYHFIDQDRFDQQLAQGDFIEHAEVFDHCYGTSRAAVMELLDAGKDVILDIDWQGARQVREAFPETVSVFILPPSVEALRQRLCHRGLDHEDVIERRMRDARKEIEHYSEYDKLIINDLFDQAVDELTALFVARRLTMKGQVQRYEALLKGLLA
ncbi:MAG TPA: guanylate kinase [Gammaproteobacteria bacterium]|nr:guanylate kinase [Gammaproteobacteria bacterium]